MAAIPCQYASGKVLGMGTFGVVREATHLRTGRVYACKSIDKAEYVGREVVLANEVEILKYLRLAYNPNIAVLRDYFETRDHLHLYFDQYGGALIDRVLDRGHFTEVQTVDIMRTVLAALETIHAAGIVHHDLKPENLLFRNTNERTNEVMIVDFGLSQCVGGRNGHPLGRQRMLTAIVGTEGYMAPEIYLNGGHGKPVDMWAIGVIAYFFLSGRRPFGRATAAEERAAVISDGYEFEPEKLWDEISDEACHFVAGCLLKNPLRRTTAGQALEHEVRLCCVQWLDVQAIVPPTVLRSLIPIGQINFIAMICAIRGAGRCILRGQCTTGERISNQEEEEEDTQPFRPLGAFHSLEGS
ncbi:kinase-like domain-containing protein [Mycena amicta]|nr:kinase-like domain-containing protein [Mycena amicta]